MRFRARIKPDALLATSQGSVLQRVWNVLVKPAKNSNTAHSTRVLTLARTRYDFAALRGACETQDSDTVILLRD